MVVTWQNPFLQPTRPPGFVAPEEWGQETPTQLPNQGVGGVGAPQPIEQVQSMFTPAEATGSGMFGGDGGGGGAQPQPNQPEGDFPSASSIERRRKLAEALMGKQMEVNHPMQAVANAVSQIAGAWMNKKADDEQAQVEKRRRDMVSGGFEKSGGNFDAMMDEWMKSGDPELVDKALDYKLRKAAAAADGGDAPTTRTFYEGGMAVTKQWNAETKQWENVGDPYPRWKGSDDGSGYDPAAPEPVEVSGGPSPESGAPASGEAPAPEGGAPDPVYKTPGPGGKWQVKPGPTIAGPDGQPVSTYFNPNDRQLYYQVDGGWKRVSKASGPAPKLMTPSQYVKLRQDYQNEVNGMEALNTYFQTVKDIPTGVNRWAIDVAAKAKQIIWGGKTLTPDEFNKLSADNQIQALLGLFRTTIVGPGVMTEYDAVRVLKALGGDPGSALQNPEVMKKILGDLYTRKQRQARIYYEEYVRQAKARGETPEPFGAPATLGGEEPSPSGGKGSNPSAPSTPRPSGTKVALPPKEKRIIGKTEYKAPNGQSFVWGRDASGKVGWIPK